MSPASPSLQPLLIVLAGVVGLFVGSFLNVVAYRTPRDLSVVEPRSFCPGCGRTLTWWENIPVISWVALGGRCRTCGMPISLRYPTLELVTGAAFALVTWAWRGSVTSVAFCALAAGAVAVSAIELDGLRAPLAVEGVATGIALPVVVVANGVQGHGWVVVGALVGTAVGWGAVLVLRRSDPACAHRGQYGRTLLLGTGCWVGTVAGVQAWALAVATGAGLASYGITALVGRRARRGRGAARETDRSTSPDASGVWLPLVVAVLVAMVASLVAMG